MAPASGDSQTQLAAATAAVTHPKVERTLRVWREGQDLYQSEAQTGVFETKFRLDYVIGSGMNGYTYLVRRGDHLFQAPLSYYSRAAKWDLSPGYESGDFASRVNKQMVGVEKLESAKEIAEVKQLVQKHHDYTKSPRAKALLDSWDQTVPKFVKVLPKDYKRMLACIDRAQSQGLTGDEAIMAAFEENARDLSRVGGN